jgi:hypothetical protein
MTAKLSTSLELLCPSAFQDLKALLCAPLSKRPAGICPAHRKCRTQGLATLSTVSALQTRGSLFQPPTLLGFTLQSFFPLGEPDEPFGSNVPLLRFLTKPGSLVRRSSGLILPKKLCSSMQPEGLVRVGALCSPGLSDLSGSPALRPISKVSIFQNAPRVLGRLLLS